MENVRIWVSGGGAVALHILVLIWFPVERQLPARADIELLLVETSRLPVTAQQPKSARQPVATPILSNAALPKQQSTPGLETIKPLDFKPLDLSRPAGWSRNFVTPGNETDDVVSAFRPQFFQQLESRRDDQARRHLLEVRSVAMHGLSIDAYTKIEGPTSRHIKTTKGCYNLQSAITGDLSDVGVGQRWYRTACKDLIWDPFQDPWHMQRLEFDRVGRAVGR